MQCSGRKPTPFESSMLFGHERLKDPTAERKVYWPEDAIGIAMASWGRGQTYRYPKESVRVLKMLAASALRHYLDLMSTAVSILDPGIRPTAPGQGFLDPTVLISGTSRKAIPLKMPLLIPPISSYLDVRYFI